MRKRYLHDRYGQADAFWEGNWERSDDDKCASAPAVDARLVRYIDKYLQPGMSLLEGGCGNCHYVRYFCDRGVRTVGVDFAEQTIRRFQRLFPKLDLRVGNILDLDFPDDRFDAYYSGGVIEHFEDGIDRQLAEAHRVIKRDGYFFVTVPHMNASRRLAGAMWRQQYKPDLDGRESFHRENLAEFIIEPPPPHFHFHEYAFTSKEMHGFLTRHQFQIVDEAVFSATYGLCDIGAYRKIAGIGQRSRTLAHKACAAPLRLIRYLEGYRFFPCNMLADLCGSLFGNLKLYVCVARK